MYQNIGNALFWIWDSLRNRQLWTRMQLAVSPVSQQMLEHFPGLSLPCDSCWWLESGSVVITLSWQCLPAPGGPSMAVLPLWNTGMVSEVWDSRSFLRGAVPGTTRPCCRARVLVCHFGSSPSVQTELHWWLCFPSFLCNFLVLGKKHVIVSALP